MWMKKNKKRLLWPLVGILLACQPPQEETPTSGQLKVLVSESHQYVIQKEAEVFQSLYEKAQVSFAGTSTRECLVHLINDSVRLVMVDRRLNDEEQRIIRQAELEIQEIKIAKDALAVVVNHLNEMQSISMETLQGIVKGEAKDWNQYPESRLKGPILLTTTDKNSGAYELLKNHFFNLEEDFTPALIAESQSQVIQQVAKNPLAIGIVSFACYLDSTMRMYTKGPEAKVRVLQMAGVDSTGNPKDYQLHQYYVYTEEYPLTYPIYVYFNNKSKLALGFSAFIASGPGQKIITKIGLAPATMPVRYVQQK